MSDDRLSKATEKRARIKAERDALIAEASTAPCHVGGVYFPNPDDATFVRGLAIDRRTRDLERLDAAIAELALADASDPFPQDAGSDDFDDEIVGAPDYAFWFCADESADDANREVA